MLRVLCGIFVLPVCVDVSLVFALIPRHRSWKERKQGKEERNQLNLPQSIQPNTEHHTLQCHIIIYISTNSIR